MFIHNCAHFATLDESLFVHTSWQIQIANLEVPIGRVRAEAEGAISGAEKAGPRKRIRLAGDTHLWRQNVSRAEFMRDDAADARILNSRAGPPAGEHIVRAAVMVGFAMCHRPNDTNLVGDFGGLFQVLRKMNALDAGFDRSKGTPIFDGSENLGIE